MRKSGASFQTPKQAKGTPVIQSEQNRDAKKNKNKRKSLPANLTNGDDNSSPKKPKIDAFSGTTDLFMQMNKSPEGKKAKKAENEKSPAKQNKKPQKLNEDAPKSDKVLGERAKRRKERLIARRVAGKERLKQTLGQVSTGDETAITQLKEHLSHLLQRPALSKSGKRKVKQLKKALKVAGVDVSAFTISPQNKDEKATQKPQAANQKKQQKGNAGKKDSAAPGKKNIQPQKKQTAAKKEEEESDEDEESESEEDNVKALMSGLKEAEDESDEDEEDESDSGQDDSLEEAEAEEDESDEDDGDDDDKEEEDSEENDEIPDKKPKIGKKVQAKVNQNNDTVSSLMKGKSRYVLFVGNLPFDVTQEDISQHFAKIGKIRDVRIPLDKQTNKCRGFAYVELLDQTTYEVISEGLNICNAYDLFVFQNFLFKKRFYN